jgi:hypothetical protein
MLKNHRLNHLCIRLANTEARDSGFNLTNKGEMGLSVGDSKMASDPLAEKMERKTGNTRSSKRYTSPQKMCSLYTEDETPPFYCARRSLLHYDLTLGFKQHPPRIMY